jgi:hypothetical protein
MKRIIIVIAFAALCAFVAQAQTAASGSTNTNASVSGSQASAHTDAAQQAQTPAGSTSLNTSGDVQAGHEKPASAADKKHSHDHSGGNPGGSAALSGGSTLQAELTKSVDAKKAKAGDEVTAKLTQDVKADGKVVLHKGTKLVGHVTEAQAHTKEQAQSKLGIVFDKAVPKGGGDVAFNGVIQAIAPPVQSATAASADLGAMAPPSGGGARPAGGGMLGGVGGAASSTVSGATSTVGGATGSVTSAAGAATNGTLGSATQGLGANGSLTSASRGALGMPGLSLSSATTGATQASVISSADHTVKLDSGTQMVLQVAGTAGH